MRKHEDVEDVSTCETRGRQSAYESGVERLFRDRVDELRVERAAVLGKRVQREVLHEIGHRAELQRVVEPEALLMRVDLDQLVRPVVSAERCGRAVNKFA